MWQKIPVLILSLSLMFGAHLSYAQPSSQPELSQAQLSAISSAQAALEESIQALEQSKEKIQEQSTEIKQLSTLCVVLSVTSILGVSAAIIESLRK